MRSEVGRLYTFLRSESCRRGSLMALKFGAASYMGAPKPSTTAVPAILLLGTSITPALFNNLYSRMLCFPQEPAEIFRD